jgi:hypothetical protein
MTHGGSQGQEYFHWLQADPHAQAGRRILQPRFQEVLRRASNRPDGEADPQMYARCVRCHDPTGLASAQDQSSLEGQAGVAQGIGCESCHGPARQWLTKHYERGVSRQSLLDLGMTDTKSVMVRARLCAACHVGSAENDVNHDMLAAGHPPLRFELASHQALIDRKHWNDAPRRLAEPQYEIKLWAAGRVASAEAALLLLESRARQAMQSEPANAPWPELAEYNCFSCHRSLRPQVGNLPIASSESRIPGVPPWQNWNITLVAPLLSPKTVGENELPPPANSFEASLSRLRAAMERSFFPSPEQVAHLAAESRATLSAGVRLTPNGDLMDRHNRPFALSVALEAASSSSPRTWEDACHRLAALLAIERAARDASAQVATNRASVAEQRLAPLRSRAREIGHALRFESDEYEWPAVFSPPGSMALPASTMSLEAAENELDAIRATLQQILSDPSARGTPY